MRRGPAGVADRRIASPMLGPYHASKFALVGLTDSLRAELARET